MTDRKLMKLRQEIEDYIEQKEYEKENECEGNAEAFIVKRGQIEIASDICCMIDELMDEPEKPMEDENSKEFQTENNDNKGLLTGG